MNTDTASGAIAVHRITRRAHGNRPGDEEVTHISEPMPLDMEPIRSEWSSPNRLHVPRVHEPEEGGSAWWLFLVAVGAVVVAAWGVFA